MEVKDDVKANPSEAAGPHLTLTLVAGGKSPRICQVAIFLAVPRSRNLDACVVN